MTFSWSGRKLIRRKLRRRRISLTFQSCSCICVLYPTLNPLFVWRWIGKLLDASTLLGWDDHIPGRWPCLYRLSTDHMFPHDMTAKHFTLWTMNVSVYTVLLLLYLSALHGCVTEWMNLPLAVPILPYQTQIASAGPDMSAISFKSAQEVV